MGSTINSTNFVSVKRAWARAWSQSKWQDEVSEVDLLDYTAEIIGLIGMGSEYFSKETYVGEIKNYKGSLPKCIDDLVAVAGYSGGDLCCCDEDGYPREMFIGMRSSTDMFHHYQRNIKDCGYNNCSGDLTYKINDSCIFTSFEKGLFLISYNKIPIDEEGYPMVVERETLLTAIASHIIWRIAYLKLLKGEIDRNIYNTIAQERDWYVKRAQTKSFNQDQAATVGNIWSRLIPKNTTHKYGHIGLGSREERYTNNGAGTIFGANRIDYPILQAGSDSISGYFYQF